jgi:hypothetical protein
MTLSLHVWSRSDGAYARQDHGSVDSVRQAWRVKGSLGIRNVVGIVTLDSEPAPEMPDKALTAFKRLLVTPGVRAGHGDGFKLDAALAHRGSDLSPVISFAAAPEILNRKREKTAERHAALVMSAPLSVDRFPDWFAGLPLSEVLDRAVAGTLAGLGCTTVGDVGSVSRGAYEDEDPDNRRDSIALRAALREAYKAAAEERATAQAKEEAGGIGAYFAGAIAREVSSWPERPVRPDLAERSRAWQESAAGARRVEGPGDPDAGPVDVVDPARRGSLRRSIVASLAQLGERNADILARRLGLDGPPLNQRAVAEGAGLTFQRIQQVETAALARIRDMHGWMAFAADRASGAMPVSLADLRREPWADGLSTPCLAQVVRAATGRRLHVVRIAGEEVVGPLSAKEWQGAADRVRASLVAVRFKLNRTGLRAVSALSMRAAERPYLDWMVREMLAGSEATRKRDGAASMAAVVRSMLEVSGGAMTEVGVRAGLASHYGRGLDHDEVTRVLRRFMPFPAGRRGLARHLPFEDGGEGLLRTMVDGLAARMEGDPGPDAVMAALYKAWPAAATEDLQAEVARIVARSEATQATGARAWDPGRERVLRGMWAEGRSSGAIASVLGTTRNSVISKINRLGLMGGQGRPSVADEEAVPLPPGP